MADFLRKISGDEIAEAVASLYAEACTGNTREIRQKLSELLSIEPSGPGREALMIEIENTEIASETGLPICQDTGTAVVFVELGNRLVVADSTIPDAVNRGIAMASREAYLRPSQVFPPVGDRQNTLDNTPAVVHLEHTVGTELKISLLAKGAGSENVSISAMLPPLAGIKGISDLAERCVLDGVSRACPPVIVGIGIGGNLETSAILAKKTLLRRVGLKNEVPSLSEMEMRITERLNATGIGPQGFGGLATVMETRILQRPCHMASLPVSICIDCHVHRVASCVL